MDNLISLFPDQAEDRYRAASGLNWSRLKVLDTSPMHYQHGLTHSRPDTPALLLGRAVHCAVLEPHRFEEEYVAYDGKVRRGKAWEAFQSDHAGRFILSQSEHAKALAIRKAVHSHSAAWALLCQPGLAERSMYWNERGRFMKARADYITRNPATGRLQLVDLKTSRDMAPVAFGRAAAQYGYHGQLAHYAAGLEVLTGEPVECLLIAVGSAAEPYDVGVYYLEDDARQAGDQYRAGLLDRLEKCEAADHWPGQAPDPMPLMLPTWALPADDETFTFDTE